jgi:hypothetical protein
MEDLVMNGTVYMRKLRHYVGVESSVVGDKNEGLFRRISGASPTAKLTILPHGGKPFPIHDFHSLTIPSTARDHAVYCMFGIEVPGRDEDGINLEIALRTLLHDRRMWEFGDTLVIFKNSPEFVRRVAVAARKAGHEIEHDAIEYVPSVYCGDMGPFRKLDAYAYQQEVRIITTGPICGDTLILNVGPLWDIVNAVELKEYQKAG